MKIRTTSLLLLIALLSGCNTGGYLVRARMSDKYPVVAPPEMVRLYTDGEAAPDSSKVLGETSSCGIFWHRLHVEHC